MMGVLMHLYFVRVEIVFVDLHFGDEDFDK